MIDQSFYLFKYSFPQKNYFFLPFLLLNEKISIDFLNNIQRYNFSSTTKDNIDKSSLKKILDLIQINA